jgi:hypothetical protein
MFRTTNDLGRAILINTPLQRGAWWHRELINRFNGFSHAAETVETVDDASRTAITPLKRGVNETRATRVTPAS